jgi:hypothetical protein
MSSIERVIKFGRVYRFTLDCGHVIERSADEVKLQQLFIGKRIGCPDCRPQSARGEVELR